METKQDKLNSEFEKLKLLYERNSDQFKYFLTWRQLMLVGYFSIIAALALAFKWAYEKQFAALFAFPFAGVWISVLFWALDRRNRQLYKLASHVGAKLEEKMRLKGMGHFGAYCKSGTESRMKMEHSMILAIFYLGSGALMLLLAFALLLEPLIKALFLILGTV